jgi:hypothetical protein
MKLSTGKVAFPIEFDNGDKDVIYFNPNDPNMYLKMQDLQEKIAERIRSFDDVKINEDGTANNPSEAEILKAMQTILCEEMDNAFGGNVSAVVFKHCSPFAIVEGRFFVMQFIDAIIPAIKSERIKAENELKDSIEKHISKYSK